jgi:hypothetical protein
VSENGLLRKKFGPKRNKTRGNRRKVHKEEFYSSLCVHQILLGGDGIKEGELDGAWGESEMHTELESLKGRYHSKELGG